ncbi:2-acylglycerol O-acyltransferase 3 [Erinaceus europaeus]|uniref:Acyltransferase n=1 Tax=Erinaceus europaeus TaxID=9365 RepID=A0A1S2ZE77_ERIEU|nr:2-acylglycerol O-acyltransferase 3 [Erinaceus europaeus]
MGDPTASSEKTPEKRRLEALSSYQFVLTFLFMGLSCSLLILWLLFTSLWLLSVLYLAWLFLDWDTPHQAGRRSQWVRNWPIWRHLRDYYPIKLVKTAELPPDRNYVLAAHPHGIMCTGVACNFCTESNGFSQHFPGLRPYLATLASLFHLPVYRDYLLALGMCPVSRQSLEAILAQAQQGQAVVILVGGAHESLYARPGEHCLKLRGRKGFVRLALRNGASLVPVYSFGENDVFRLKAFPEGSWQHRCQTAFKNFLGFAPCLFWGQSIFSNRAWGLLPFASPITTVVGSPISVPQRANPSQEEVDHYHRLYMEALERLFEEHKQDCGVPEATHLTFI